VLSALGAYLVHGRGKRKGRPLQQSEAKGHKGCSTVKDWEKEGRKILAQWCFHRGGKKGLKSFVSWRQRISREGGKANVTFRLCSPLKERKDIKRKGIISPSPRERKGIMSSRGRP